MSIWELPRWCSSKESACQCRRRKKYGFDPWIRKIPWRRKWQATPVFLPEESQVQRRLAGYSPWGCKELDMVECLSAHTHTHTHIYTHKWTYDKFCVNFKFLQLQNNCYVQWLSLESSDFFRNFWTSLIIRSILSKGIITSFVCLIPLCRKDNNSWTIKEMKPQDFLQLFCSLQS